MDSIENQFIVRRSVPTNAIYGGRHEIEVNEAIRLTSPKLGDISLIRKKTPYTSNPVELMITIPEVPVSQLTELKIEQGAEFFNISEEILKISSKKVSGRPLLSINQQHEGVNIPEKFAADGTEVKVQTIDPLHGHLFVDSGGGEEAFLIKHLDDTDKYDFYDVFSIAIAEYLYCVLSMSKDFSSINLKFDISKPPYGLLIEFPANSDNHEMFSLIQRLQLYYLDLYYQVYSEMVDLKGEPLPKRQRFHRAQELLKEIEISEASKHSLITMLSASVPLNLENRKFLRFIQGPALTWIIDFFGDSKRVYMGPKILSRGNAMEALGVWVDQAFDRTDEGEHAQIEFYKYLIKRLGKDFQARKGEIFNFIGK